MPPYTVAGDPGTPPRALIGPGGDCRTLHGEPLEETTRLGVRTWGNAPDGPDGLLVGTHRMESGVSRRLLDALPPLPPLPHLPGDAWTCPLTPALEDGINRDAPGRSVVLDRVPDPLPIAAVRTRFARPAAAAALAARTGVPRAAPARRFTDLVGEPPMAYLTGWRLALAADLLRETDRTVERIARQVGHGGAFAFSAAFKRVRGVSPQECRSAYAGKLPDRHASSPPAASARTLSP